MVPSASTRSSRRHADAVVGEASASSLRDRARSRSRTARRPRSAQAWRSPRSAASRRRRRRWRRARGRKCRDPNRPNGPSDAAGAKRRPRSSAFSRRRSPRKQTSVVKFASSIMKPVGANRGRAPAALISRKDVAISSRREAPRRGKKRGGSAGRGPADPPACVAISSPIAARGLGGKKHRARRRTEPSRLDAVLPVRCGAPIDHKRAKLRHFSRLRERLDCRKVPMRGAD